MTALLAIDGGTESLRAALFALDGACLGAAAAPYPVNFLAGGRAEQRPSDWWSSLTTAVRAVLGQTRINSSEIAAICLDTTCCTLVAVDHNGAPLRDAILWMDVRAGKEANEISSIDDPYLQVNGGGMTPVQAEWMIPKALWLKRNEPECYQRTATLYEYQDHLNRLLTGRVTGSLSGMVGRWHYLPDRGGWPLGIFNAVGLDDLLDKLPQDILRPGQFVGDLLPSVAAELGLRAGTPVFQGGADAYIAVIGMGVAAPGEMALVTGSSHLHLAITDTPFHRRGILGTFRDAVYEGRWIVDGGQTSTGSALAWLQRISAHSMGYDGLNEVASRIPIGCDGLVALDHFQGNR
jgi:ribulose kinase